MSEQRPPPEELSQEEQDALLEQEFDTFAEDEHGNIVRDWPRPIPPPS